RTSLFSAGLIAALLTTGAYADQAKQEKKFCDTLEKFSVDLSKLEAVTPQSTMGELRAAADRVEKDADDVTTAARKIKTPTAKQFTQPANQWRSELKSMSSNVTVEQAKARIKDDLTNTRDAAQKLADESQCPSATP